MKYLLLKAIRILNKAFQATQNERIHTERLVKSKYVYEFREL